jgi:hypothetical protein
VIDAITFDIGKYMDEEVDVEEINLSQEGLVCLKKI